MAGLIPPIEEAVTVSVAPQRAFALFHAEFGRWWPGDYTFSGPVGLQSISLGAAPGALCTEIGPHGFRIDWGRMLEVDPPHRLKFLWQIADDSAPQPDPDKSSEVEVIFEPAGETTLVRLIHGGFDRCGDGAADYRDELASEFGWPLIIARFADYAARR